MRIKYLIVQRSERIWYFRRVGRCVGQRVTPGIFLFETGPGTDVWDHWKKGEREREREREMEREMEREIEREIEKEIEKDKEK